LGFSGIGEDGRTATLAPDLLQTIVCKFTDYIVCTPATCTGTCPSSWPCACPEQAGVTFFL
jgi:hypothetical protein